MSRRNNQMSTSKSNVTRKRPSGSTKGATKKPASAKRPSRAKKPDAPAVAVAPKVLPPTLPPPAVKTPVPVHVVIEDAVPHSGYLHELVMIGWTGLGVVAAVATHGLTVPVGLFCVGLVIVSGMCISF